MVRISERVINVLTGEADYESLDDTGRSVISLHLYLAAKKLCAIKDREQRHATLATLPPTIQPLIKLNAIKIWNDMK
jgi:hypothetical protein